MRRARLSRGTVIYTKWLVQRAELFWGGRLQVLRFFALDTDRALGDYPTFQQEGFTGGVFVGKGGSDTLARLRRDENVGLIIVGDPGTLEDSSEGMPEFRLVVYGASPASPSGSSPVTLFQGPHGRVLEKMKRTFTALEEEMMALVSPKEGVKSS